MSGDAKYVSLYYSLVHQGASDFYKEISKNPGGKMSYIPPWHTSSCGSLYPHHMLPPSLPSSFNGDNNSLQSRPVYHHQLTTKSQSNSIQKQGSSLSVSSSISSVPVSDSNGASSTIHALYEPQAYNQSESVRNDHVKQECLVTDEHDHFRTAAGPSSLDSRSLAKKYTKRSPAKFPSPEQLPGPVMFTYQGRGRPRKNLAHASSLSLVAPVAHPPAIADDTDDEENKPYKCLVCNKGFKVRSGLLQHDKSHGTDRPYICPDCGKLFRQPTHLQQHMRVHTGEKPYDCAFCEKSFRQRTILNQHLRIHTGEKPYVCIECGKQFRQKAILDQHYRSHLGEKPFACPHPSCRKHFREMSSLISHVKCHKDVPDPRLVLHQAKRPVKEEGEPPNLNDQDQLHDQSSTSYSHMQSEDSSPYHPVSTPTPETRGTDAPHGSPNSAPPPQMSVASLFPYPHSIFPASSYMMNPSEARYHHPSFVLSKSAQ